MKNRRNIATAAVTAALLLAGASTADATSTTHCGVKTTWRLAGEDDNADVKVKLWRKPSTLHRTAFCGEAWDLKRDPNYRVLLKMQPDNAPWSSVSGASSTYKLVRVPDSIQSVYVEADLSDSVVWTGWWKP